MWITKLFTTAMVAWLGLMPSSCSKSKTPAAQKPANVEVVATSLTNKNLGELSLTNHYETCVRLGEGKSCTIRPTLLSRDNLKITLALESKSASGKPRDLSVVQVVTRSGKPFEVAVGDMNLTMTPRLCN